MADTPNLINNGIISTTQTPMKANNLLLFVQSVSDEVGSKGVYPAYQTDLTVTIGGDTNDADTKQGRYSTKKDDAQTVEGEFNFSPKDPTLNMLKQSKESGNNVKIWVVQVDNSVKTDATANPSGGSGATPTPAYPAWFGYALVDSVKLKGSTGDSVSVTASFNVTGKLQAGQFPLTDEEVATLNEIYGYENPGETTGDIAEKNGTNN